MSLYPNFVFIGATSCLMYNIVRADCEPSTPLAMSSILSWEEVRKQYAGGSCHGPWAWALSAVWTLGTGPPSLSSQARMELRKITLPLSLVEVLSQEGQSARRELWEESGHRILPSFPVYSFPRHTEQSVCKLDSWGHFLGLYFWRTPKSQNSRWTCMLFSLVNLFVAAVASVLCRFREGDGFFIL